MAERSEAKNAKQSIFSQIYSIQKIISSLE